MSRELVCCLIAALLLAGGVLGTIRVTRRAGLNTLQRVSQAIHLNGAVLFFAAFSVGLAWLETPLAAAPFVVLAVWLLTESVTLLMRRLEQRRARRAATSLGIPTPPRPIPLTHLLARWYAVSLLLAPIFLVYMVLVGGLGQRVLLNSDAIAYGACVMAALAGLLVTVQKLVRDGDVRSHERLVSGIDARLRAERSVGYDAGYRDGQGGSPRIEYWQPHG